MSHYTVQYLDSTQHHQSICEYAEDAFEQNDSAWNQFRQVPLSEKEKEIYVARDSLNKVQSDKPIAVQDEFRRDL